ncbi:MAG: hydroxysqualene dehydroxylase HpnE [Planctomycetota bacterium]
MSARPRAIVIGGGVSGIAAAAALADAGREVRLLERRAFLGGRAYSFTDRATGDEVDNGQHVLLGCCTNARDVLARLSVGSLVDWYDRFHYLLPGGRRCDLGRASLPAPLHYLPGLLGWKALPFRDRLGVVRAFAALMFTGRARREIAARAPFSAWLARRHPSALARSRFWAPIIEGAVNETLDRAAGGPCLQVFLEAFMAHRDAARMGVPKLGLTRLVAPGAERYLEASGGRVRTRARVAALRVEAGRIAAARLADGEEIAGDEFVVALPPNALDGLAVEGGAPLRETRTGDEFAYSSITGIHLWLDRRVTELPHGALLDSPIHWFFDRPSAADGVGQRLALVVSASRSLEDRGQAEIATLAEAELRRFLPGMEGARVLHHVVVKETRATFSATPGIEAMRPGPATPHANAVLAGDWTDVGWPSTLEGSIRSGRLAAGALLGRGRELLTPDLAPGPLARLLVRT